MEGSRRSVLAHSLALATAATADPATSQIRSVPGRSVNVLDFGAVADGIADDTEAFNRATRADDPWSEDLIAAIKVPAGRYLLRGTVYLRRGQSLIGEGLSTVIDATGAAASTFILGRRRAGGRRGTPDPGGSPVSVESLMSIGGSPKAGLFYIAAEGFHVRNLFLSAVGLGLEIEGADGIVSNITIDQCLSGIYIRKSQNIIFENLHFYLANFALTLDNQCVDILVSSSIFCYTKYASVLLADGANGISSVKLIGCTFTSSEPFDTFLAHVYSRANQSDLQVASCTFRNIPGYAIWQGSGVGLTITIESSVIDGQRTNPAYGQSGKAGGIRTGYGSFVVRQCSFRNLAGEAVRVDPGLRSLSIEGGMIASVQSGPIRVDANVEGSIRVRGLDGIARTDWVGKDQRVRLPSLGPRTRWQVLAVSRDPGAPVQASQWSVSNRLLQEVTSVGSVVETASGREPDGSLTLVLPADQFGKAPILVEADGYG